MDNEPRLIETRAENFDGYHKIIQVWEQIVERENSYPYLKITEKTIIEGVEYEERVEYQSLAPEYLYQVFGNDYKEYIQKEIVNHIYEPFITEKDFMV